MKRIAALALLGVATAAGSTLGCRPAEHAERRSGPVAEAALRAGEPLRPLPAAAPLDPRKVELGRRLFADPRLSADQSLSCATCHDLARGGADGRPLPVGLEGKAGRVNTPTVFNSAFNFRQFWDGRVETLEEQVDDARQGEMGSTWSEICARLEADAEIRGLFAALYGGSVEPVGVRDALAAFVASLVTPGSRLDRYLAGDDDALSDDEKEGYRLFKTYGCASCHQGVGVGGNMFQRFGTLGDYFGDRGGATEADLGRFNVTGLEEDRHVFKVPMLRNVAVTAPYFHDGQAQTLEQAVQTMARYQLGRFLTERETRLLVAFLHTLTGTYEGASLDGAELPS